MGWGAHLEHHLAQGQWLPADQQLNINLLELRAIHLAVLHFHDRVEARDVLVLMDNVTAKAHINRMGGTHLIDLMRETLLLNPWAETHLNSIDADHILGVANSQADALSRHQLDHMEHLFQEIASCFGLLSVDLFASHIRCRGISPDTKIPGRRPSTCSTTLGLRACYMLFLPFP